MTIPTLLRRTSRNTSFHSDCLWVHHHQMRTSPVMKDLTSRLCLTLIFFLGTIEVSWSADRRSGWDPAHGVFDCANAPSDLFSGSVSLPFIANRTRRDDIQVKLNKSPAFYRTTSKSYHNEPNSNDSYRVVFPVGKIEICFHYKTYPDAIIVSDQVPASIKSPEKTNDDLIFITILSQVNCGAPCAYGIAQTFSFSPVQPNAKGFYPTEEFCEAHCKKYGVALFPPPRFLSQLSTKEVANYKLTRPGSFVD